MVSNIDENKPVTGIDQPAKVIRDNFAITKVEIEDLQAIKLDRNGDNMLGVLKLVQISTVNLPSPAANISGILFNADTSSLSFSNGLSWIDVINTVLTGSAVLDFNSISPSNFEDLTINVSGAVIGNEVALGLPSIPAAGIIFNAFVSAANTVTIRAHNNSGISVDPGNATYNVRVFQ